MNLEIMNHLRNHQTLLIALLVTAIPTATQAHFTWLSTDADSRALLYFAESPASPDYKLPDAVAKAQVVWQQGDEQPQTISMSKVESDDYIGMKSEKSVAGPGVFTSHCRYGNYHGTLLTYYMKHYAGNLSKALAVEGKEQAKGFVFDLRPSLIDKGMVLTATRDGEPLKGVGITLIDPAGEQVAKQTNAEGVVKFYNLAAGKLAIIGSLNEKKSGEVNGEKYKSLSHYLTVTLDYSPQPAEAAANVQSALPALPEGLASFGAATCDGFLYVYSGHIGRAHDHSKENLSNHFRRISLNGGTWQELHCPRPLQGLALVPYAGKLVRVGGMVARNAPEEAEDMVSTDTVEIFDPANSTWSDLPPLPEPRSSLDAVVIDGKLYVVGGWELSGDAEGKWHDTAWKLDLDHIDKGWQELPPVPFRRRALAATYLPNMLVVIGGIDEAGAISRRVDGLNLDTGQWRELAELPGEDMQGFGVSAWNHRGKAYVSGSSGIVLQLSADGTQWTEVARHRDRRFFHRLVPAGRDRLLMIGGASLDRSRHVGDSEWVELESSR